MTGPDPDQARAEGRGWIGLAGQIGGFGLGLGLLWLQSGSDFIGLLEPLDPVLGFGLAAWPLTAAAVVWVGWRRARGRPLLPVLIGLAPWALSSVLAAMSVGNLDFLDSSSGACPVWLALNFDAERLRLIGLLASACIWLGCLPWLVGLTNGSGGARPGWVLWVALGSLAAVALWTRGDPLLPRYGRMGGPLVRGLWPLVLAIPVCWAWAQGLGRWARSEAAERGLALGLAAWGGLLASTAGIGLLHRADGLQRVLAADGPLAWPGWTPAGLSLTAAGLRLAPLALVAWGLSFAWLARRSGGPGLRRGLAVVIAWAALGLLAVSHEVGTARGFDAACPPGVETPTDCRVEERLMGICLSQARDALGRPESRPTGAQR